MGSALKDKRFRCVVRDPADPLQPDGWTQVQVEAERRVRVREKAKITLPSPELLKRIMLDAPSLEDVMEERADDKPRALSDRRRVRRIPRN
jgi:hypothetical protein